MFSGLLVSAANGRTVAFTSAFPNLQYIFLVRRDTVAQAISHWKALQTDVWTSTAPDAPTASNAARFEFGAIDHLVNDIESQNVAWRRYFQTAGITPFTVAYEDLVDGYEETAIRILEYLGIDVPHDLKFASRQLKKQSDARSAEWARRYRAIKEAGAPD